MSYTILAFGRWTFAGIKKMCNVLQGSFNVLNVIVQIAGR